MTRGKQHYKDNIYENTYLTLFTATNTAMLEYPFIVGRYDQSSPTHAKQAEEYILDSAIGDESVGNEDVLDRAEDIGAEIVVAADIMNDPHQTTDNIVEMFKLAEERETDFEVLVPLQFNSFLRHEDHYDNVARRLGENGIDIDEKRLYIGGINQKSAEEQIRRCIKFREHVGTGAYLHGLGVGATREWIVTIRNCPWLLDSMDNSSIVQNFVYSSKLLKPNAEWAQFDRPRGTNSTVVSVQYREASLDLFNYMISSDIREEDALNEFEDPDSLLAKMVEQHQQWYDQQSTKQPVCAD